jgi:hypothetical protein
MVSSFLRVWFYEKNLPRFQIDQKIIHFIPTKFIVFMETQLLLNFFKLFKCGRFMKCDFNSPSGDSQIRIWIWRKLKADWILVMHATIQSTIFCLLVCCRKTRKLECGVLPVVLYGCETCSFDIKGRTQSVWEQGAEEDIWTQAGWSDRRLGRAA